ncbi:ferredoxin-type protein NapF [Candidatus Marithioploca araucensis]|uniref:Ferredoxin-type protein NapF n=1 Tax=Candidatus Marithioploca araucensis TaxID=70273 RepID=A0ABT7VQX9_9GAMM|nr:ferredoxin-type protein NapF [Candidatus Marithioploca araucensis]
MATFSISRLQFLRGDFSGKQQPLRPPWSPSETEFTTKCERCGECIKVCPEGILEKGRGGFPQVNFKRGECTFCGLCADHCPNNVLQRIENIPPWQIKAYIETNCLAKQGVICLTCRENCELKAIQLPLSPVAVPIVNLEECSGCGACYQICPVTAITIRLMDK